LIERLPHLRRPDAVPRSSAIRTTVGGARVRSRHGGNATPNTVLLPSGDSDRGIIAVRPGVSFLRLRPVHTRRRIGRPAAMEFDRRRRHPGAAFAIDRTTATAASARAKERPAAGTNGNG